MFGFQVFLVLGYERFKGGIEGIKVFLEVLSESIEKSDGFAGVSLGQALNVAEFIAHQRDEGGIATSRLLECLEVKWNLMRSSVGGVEQACPYETDEKDKGGQRFPRENEWKAFS